MNPALNACLRAPPQARTIGDVADCWQAWQSLGSPGTGPAELADAGGITSDRVGWAFASGYPAALRVAREPVPKPTKASCPKNAATSNR